jgi:hypothetical protein
MMVYAYRQPSIPFIPILLIACLGACGPAEGNAAPTDTENPTKSNSSTGRPDATVSVEETPTALSKEYALLYASEGGVTIGPDGGIHRAASNTILRATIQDREVRHDYLILRNEQYESFDRFYWLKGDFSVLYFDERGYSGGGWYIYTFDSSKKCTECPTSIFDTLGYFPSPDGGWFGRQERDVFLRIQFISYERPSETMEYTIENLTEQLQHCSLNGFSQRPDFSSAVGRMAGTLRCNDPDEPEYHALQSLVIVDFKKQTLEFLPGLENIPLEDALFVESRWGGARFSPDGDKVALVVADSPDPEANLQIWIWSISASKYILKHDVAYQRFINCSSSEKLLYSVPAWSFSPDDWMNPTWSYDGRWLALGTGDILLINIETGEEKHLTHTDQVLERNPVWSPDNKFIAYTAYWKESQCPGKIVPSELFILPSDGSDPMPLDVSAPQSAKKDTWDCCAVWRPE